LFVGWGFTPDPTGGAYSAPPGPQRELYLGSLILRGRGREFVLCHRKKKEKSAPMT